MEALPKNVWKRLAREFPADESDSARAADLFREYESAGHLNRPAAELLQSGTPVIADFFRRVAMMHSLESPILRRRDTRWMSEFDYTLVNIRAAGVGESPGNFLTAAMFLGTLRTRGVIVAPVTRGPTEKIDIIESHAVLRDELADFPARNAGIIPEVQMVAFCEAAHLLGLVLGYDLDYRVDPMAAVVLNRPELFFWTKEGRFDGNEHVQDQLRAEVRELVASVRKAGGAVERSVFGSALAVTALAPRLSSDGSGRTPLALRRSIGEGTGDHREEAVAYWGRVFDLWRDRYGFDFLVLRGTRGVAGDPEVPDRSLVRKVADAVRKAGVRRNIGVAAEGNPVEVESFGVQGVDLVIGNNAGAKADYQWFNDVFSLDGRLRRINLGRKLRFSVPMEVDPGEKNSRLRRERALIKRFVARFLGAGPSRRPLLETMGALEGAWGYSTSLNKASCLGWMPDPEDAARGRFIEGIAGDFRDMIDSGERLDKHLDERTAWWVLGSKRGLLIPVVSVENENLLPPETVRIDYAKYLKKTDALTVLEFDFSETRGLLRLNADTVIDAGPIPYRGFRLYAVS